MLFFVKKYLYLRFDDGDDDNDVNDDSDEEEEDDGGGFLKVANQSKSNLEFVDGTGCLLSSRRLVLLLLVLPELTYKADMQLFLKPNTQINAINFKIKLFIL